MEVLSRKTVDYSNLKTFGVSEFSYIKQDKLNVRIVKCAFIGYLERMNCYK